MPAPAFAGVAFRSHDEPGVNLSGRWLLGWKRLYPCRIADVVTARTKRSNAVAQVIFLHGASSSGKSTIAKALQARIEKPFWHISIDHLRDSGVLPMNRFRSGEFAWADARQAFFDGFHASLAAYSDAGNNLILEHILDTNGWLEKLCNLLERHDVFFVAVHCPLEVLIEREKRRGDRPVGSAKRDFETNSCRQALRP